MIPVILISAAYPGALPPAADETSCAVVVGKPFDARTLHRALGEFLLLRGGLALGAGTVVSALAGDETAKDLIESFVRDLAKAADDAAEAMKAGDATACRKICLSLKGNGAPHGFKVVTDAASVALTALGGAENLDNAGSEVRRLIEVCRRCTAG